ncbi:hypothetical protein [Halobacteriovorax sp. JY17]|uniref:hypothetical protein n=1 Tax=Halobacteriovorax sp. JY17 TaxID=2014617 RepID=UPI000C3E4662|nr:hypothetical protein [Halobacteriovorax sp. JY17]PIK16204.1 MAG: hypothetical protein CES88_05575 [Halobacteriovorax sp. JY17]
MKKFEDLAEWSPKKMRTLRNNLNNRLESYKTSGDNAKPLQTSHALYGLSEEGCQELLKKVTKLLKTQK